jgi:hypothetical protein
MPFVVHHPISSLVYQFLMLFYLMELMFMTFLAIDLDKSLPFLRTFLIGLCSFEVEYVSML